MNTSQIIENLNQTVIDKDSFSIVKKYIIEMEKEDTKFVLNPKNKKEKSKYINEIDYIFYSIIKNEKGEIIKNNYFYLAINLIEEIKYYEHQLVEEINFDEDTYDYYFRMNHYI